MVGSTGTLMTMRLVRSKLRKREETTSASPAQIEAQTTTYTTTPQLNHINNNNNNNINHHQRITTSASDSNVIIGNCNGGNEYQLNNYNGSSDPSFNQNNSNAWVFPPLPPQPNIYNCNTNIDALIQANEKNGFKGFRKQFSGRFKRLVAKKPQEPAPAIPPELKPQLKTIYVY